MGFVSNSSTSSFIIIGYNIPMENVMRSYEGFVDIRTEFPAIYHFMNRHKDILFKIINDNAEYKDYLPYYEYIFNNDESLKEAAIEVCNEYSLMDILLIIDMICMELKYDTRILFDGNYALNFGIIYNTGNGYTDDLNSFSYKLNDLIELFNSEDFVEFNKYYGSPKIISTEIEC